jgi:hypothetical protein
LEQWRNGQEELTALRVELQAARRNWAQLENAAAALRKTIFQKEAETGALAAADRGRLDGIEANKGIEARKVAGLEMKITDLARDQALRARDADVFTEDWIRLCDVVGRLGAESHESALPFFDQWIVERPGLWHLHLARGLASLHVGNDDRTLADLELVNAIVQADLPPAGLAFITAVHGYALCKQGKIREGERLLAQAKKLDPKSWWPCYLRGWSNRERGNHSAAERAFRLAGQLGAPIEEVDVAGDRADSNADGRRDDRPAGAPEPPLRIWTDNTEEFTIEAEFAGLSGRSVKLKTASGRTVTVPLERLSDADQQYVRSRR